MFYIHRLVAKYFLGNYSDDLCVNHKDENKINNSVENLEMCSIGYNNNYGTRIIRSGLSRMKNCVNLDPVLQYTIDGKFIKKYPSAATAGRALKKKRGGLIRKACKLNKNCKKYSAYGYI